MPKQSRRIWRDSAGRFARSPAVRGWDTRRRHEAEKQAARVIAEQRRVYRNLNRRLKRQAEEFRRIEIHRHRVLGQQRRRERERQEKLLLQDKPRMDERLDYMGILGLESTDETTIFDIDIPQIDHKFKGQLENWDHLDLRYKMNDYAEENFGGHGESGYWRNALVWVVKRWREATDTIWRRIEIRPCPDFDNELLLAISKAP